MSLQTTSFARVFSIIAVMIIHATSSAEHEFSNKMVFLSDGFSGVLLNQLARFSVPIFIFISGYGLAASNLSKMQSISIENLKQFFQKRFMKIGIPFLFWTVLLLFIFRKFPSIHSFEDVFLAFKKLSEHLFIRGADYHFYFFIIILQCYFLFPIFTRRINTKILIGLFLLHILYASPSHLFFQNYQIARPSFPSSFFLYWQFYFYFGIYIQANFSELIKEKLFQKRYFFAGTALLFFFVLLIEYVLWAQFYHARGKIVPGYYNHFSRISVTLYSISIALALIGFDRIITETLNKNKKLSFWIEICAKASFTVFIFHTWILRLLNLILPDSETLLLCVLLIFFSFFPAILLEKFMPYRLFRLLSGLPDRQ